MKYDQSKFDKIDALNEEYKRIGLYRPVEDGLPVGVVYENIYYPIMSDIDQFFYLGGNAVRMILKNKCILKDTGKSRFYEAIASDHDIEIGKSPIIPIGCPKNTTIIPSKVKNLEQSLVLK